MNESITNKLIYRFADNESICNLPRVLTESLQVISQFLSNHDNNKLCIVFPSKDHVAQWLIPPLIFDLLLSDFEKYKDDINKAYLSYKPGDKLFLNNKAIVEWIRHDHDTVTFVTKAGKNSSGAQITVNKQQVLKLRKAPQKRVLSSIRTVKSVLPKRIKTPTENLLEIETYGNRKFVHNSLCLISTFKSYDDSIREVLLKNAEIDKYFKPGKIDDIGNVSEISPFLISNNFTNLLSYFYLSQYSPVSKIIIDGFNSLTPRGDFSDIYKEFNIPTILITDLSEIESFSEIKNLGFEFFNFASENITVGEIVGNSPFEPFEQKLKRSVSFKFDTKLCNDANLEVAAKKLHSLPPDDSDNNLNILKISLIQLFNLLSRICYVPDNSEISMFNEKINSIEAHFSDCRLWLGESEALIEEAISHLRNYIVSLSEGKTSKCIKLEELTSHKYDYIICPTGGEASSLRSYLIRLDVKVISLSELSDNLLSHKSLKAVLTGWPKSTNLNKLLSSFLFSKVTVLFYHFENKYYNSFRRRNLANSKNVRTTISKTGNRTSDNNSENGFEKYFKGDSVTEPIDDNNTPDIFDFEFKIEATQYSKYSGKGDLAESSKARRIDFENDTFIYATDSHKFLVINELIDSLKPNPKLHSKTFEALKVGDIISFINTDRDVLVELVQKGTKPDELTAIEKWTGLWKNLLREHYASTGNDFTKLVEDLRDYECNKHPATIKNWLQDDNLIGPHSDDDLLSIAMLTNSELLGENINTVREAINKMISLRFQASTVVRDKIKGELRSIANSSIINSSVEIEDLGRVEIMKIIDLKREPMDIDKKYVNRLLTKELI